MKRLLLLSVYVLCSLVALSADFTVDGISYNITSTDKLTVEVTSSSVTESYSGNVVIPKRVEDEGKSYSVTSIGDRAFYQCHRLNSVDIPNSILTIGAEAFWDDTALISVTIPNSVTSIGGLAFAYCSRLTSIYIPNSVTNIINNNAFCGCAELTSIVVDNNNPVFDSREKCNAIIETANNKLITGCKTTAIPNTVTIINDWAFEGCSGLISLVIPQSVKKIGRDSFKNCSNLKTVTIPNSVETIGFGAFEGCSKLATLSIPNSVATIEAYSFYDCYSLTSITIPNSVVSIGVGAFRGSGLTEVISMIEKPFEIDKNVFICRNSKGYYYPETLYVPIGTKEKYESTEGWDVFQDIIERAIDPSDGGKVDYGNGSDIDHDTNLSGNVVGNIYYNIADENGEYSSAEGCIVVRKPTSDEVVSGIGEEDLFGEGTKDAYTGIIFMVQAGSGTITVNAESTGGMTLKVKVGNNKPTEIELNGKMKAKFPYSVSEPSYVYIYAGGGGSNAKGMNKAAGNGELKIYGIEWSSGDTDEISNVNRDATTNDCYYNLNGQRVNKPTKKGVFIVNGKKMVIKN